MSIFSFPERVNERAARLVAGAVVLLSLTALVTHAVWLPAVLAIGFGLRVGWGPRFSPLAKAAVGLAGRLGSPVLVPGRPKRFAQGIGLVVTTFAAITRVTELHLVSDALLATLAVFATLESVFAFCFGCWIFGRLQGLGWIAADHCEVCAVEPTVASGS